MSGSRAVLSVVFAWAATQSPATPGGPTRVTVSVVTTAGVPIADLRAPDFAVSVNGRPIAHEVVQDRAPLTIFVLIDNSLSVPLSNRQVRRIVLDGLFRSATDTDEAIVTSVTGVDRWVAGLPTRGTTNAQAMLAQAQLSPTEPSPLWDALVRSSAWIRTRGAAPPAVLLLTDGRATGNHCSVNDAVTAMGAVQTSVSVLLQASATEVQRAGAATVTVHPGPILRQVAEITGGHYIEGAFTRLRGPVEAAKVDAEVDRDRDLMRLWAQAVRRRFTLQFTVPASLIGSPLAVAVRRSGATVHAPHFVPGSGPVPCLPTRPTNPNLQTKELRHE